MTTLQHPDWYSYCLSCRTSYLLARRMDHVHTKTLGDIWTESILSATMSGEVHEWMTEMGIEAYEYGLIT